MPGMDYFSSPENTNKVVQMAIIESSLQIDKNLPVPVYLQITNGIIGLIRRGLLKPESALPGSRVLAAALTVHRKTVVAAYDELDAQGWTDVVARKGIFVAKKLPDIRPKGLVAGMKGWTRAAAGAAPGAFAGTTFFDVD